MADRMDCFGRRKIYTIAVGQELEYREENGAGHCRRISKSVAGRSVGAAGRFPFGLYRSRVSCAVSRRFETGVRRKICHRWTTFRFREIKPPTSAIGNRLLGQVDDMIWRVSALLPIPYMSFCSPLTALKVQLKCCSCRAKRSWRPSFGRLPKWNRELNVAPAWSNNC